MRNKLKILVPCLLFVGLLSFLSTVNAAPGDWDATFSQDGKLYGSFVFVGNDSIYGTAIQTDGKIVAVGQAAFGGVSSCGISRYTTDGTLDPTFDGDGRAIIPTGRTFICRAVAIQANGKIVAAGTKNNGTNDDFAVVRYNTDGSLDTSFDSDGIVITPRGSSNDRAFAVAIQTDGKIVVAGSSSGLGLVRYNTDGSLDTSFDSDGMVFTPVGLDSSFDVAYAVVIQTDGKIAAAGRTSSPGSNFDFALVRYNTNGSLDTSFDSDGKVTTDVGSSTADIAYAVAIQSDGKIIAAGQSIISSGGSPFPTFQSEFSLVRYNTDGSLDTSFDSDGKVITSVLSTSEQANAIAIQTDGGIVIAGNQSTDGSFYNYALARYNTNGSLDTSFDSDGMVFTPVGLGNDAANGMATQTDGKIVAAGYTNNNFAVVRYNTNGSLDTSFSSDGITSNDVGFLQSSARATAIQANGKFAVAGYTQNLQSTDFAVIRYNADGSPDTSFDSDGKVVTPVVSDNDEARAVAVQADGKVVAAGVYYNGTSPHFAVVRYNNDGSLDTSFDSDGMVFTPLGLGDHAYAVAIQADGKIVVAGASDGGSNFDFALVRYNTDGSLDSTFDADGKVITPVMDFDQAYAIAFQPDGKIVAAGRTYNGSNVDFAVVRYNVDGSLDTSFDSDGKATTPVLSADEMATAVAVQPDGKIVAAGFSHNGTNNDFALVRYNANGSLDTSFDSDGKLTTPVLSGVDQANAVAIQANGKIVAAGYTNNGNQNNDFALVRYNPDGSLDATYNADGKATFDFWGLGNDILYGMALDSSGRAVVVGEASGNFAVARILGDFKSPFDYDGDGKTDLSVFRTSNATWYLLNSSNGSLSATTFGLASDKIAPADYDGDGRADIAVFRDGNWYLLQSTASFSGISFGSPGDKPQPADYDGDGKADVAVFRPSNGTWYLLRSRDGFTAVNFGISSDRPVAADYDGDGRADIAVYRDGNWYLLRSRDGFVSINFGVAEDKPVVGDYDGDGKSDIAIWRPSNGYWYYLRSDGNGVNASPFGSAGDIPAPGDYDGDGKFDLAVFRPSQGNWYILNSSNNSVRGQNWGVNQDLPTPAAFIP